MKTISSLKITLASLAFVFSAPAFAEIAVGSQLQPLQLKDQHDKDHSINERTQHVVFARDMDGNKIITKAFESIPADQLSSRGYVYVADISGMPTMVSKMFALPKMKKYPYPVLLDREAKATKEFPSKPNQATVMSLKDLKVESIRHFGSANELKKAIAP